MRTLVLVAFSLPLAAQINDFSTTGDGSTLYFTSPMILRGAPPATRPETRLYRLGPAGLSLYFERGPLGPPVGGGSSDGISRPYVSSDGRTVAFTLSGLCFDAECRSIGAQSAELRGAYDGSVGLGTVQLSRNGQWAVVRPQIVPGPNPGPILPPDHAILVDVRTGAQQRIPALLLSDFVVANDGSVLVATPAPALWKDGVTTPIAGLPGPFRIWALTPDGRHIVYNRIQLDMPGVATLRMRDLAAGEDRVLYAAPQGRQLWYQAMSDDGRYHLFRTSSQRLEGEAWVVDAQTLQAEPLPLGATELTVNGTIGGDGRIVYLGTTNNRIAKFTLVGGRVALSETALEGPPFVSGPRVVAPGSAIRVRIGGSIMPASARILLDGRPLVPFGREGDEILVQVPWDQPVNLNATAEVIAPPIWPMESRAPMSVAPQSPMFERATGTAFGGIKAVKGDFSGLVTEPPKPGEIVHLYMTGLGMVERPPQTGQPSPPEPNRLLGPVECRFLPHPLPSETLYGGLAPGMIGIYQLSFRMPSEVGSGLLTGLQCRIGTGQLGAFWGAPVPTP